MSTGRGGSGGGNDSANIVECGGSDGADGSRPFGGDGGPEGYDGPCGKDGLARSGRRSRAKSTRALRTRLTAMAENLTSFPFLAHTGGCAVWWGRMSWKFSSIGGNTGKDSKPGVCIVAHAHTLLVIY